MADDEIKALLKQILDSLPTLATKAEIQGLAGEVQGLHGDMQGLRDDVRSLTARLETEARVLNARLDEQGKVLVALFPRHIAAVPPAAE